MRREVMQFIMDNYIWFAVGGIVIIMAIIGYFADKTDFGRKTYEKEPKAKKEKKQKKEKKAPEPQKIEVDAKGINELTQSMADTLTEDTQEETMDDLYAPLENTETQEEVDASLYEPLVPLTNEETTETNVVEEPAMEVQEPITTEVEVPMVDSMATMEEEPKEVELQPFTPSTIEEPIEENVEENIEPLTQPIEPLTEEPIQIPTTESDTTEEDDVWKF